MVSLADEGGGATDGAGGGTRVFIGSFNINSQDLGSGAARAWLKEAEGADIVALGLQVQSCCTHRETKVKATQALVIDFWVGF